jgi:phosphoserine phosphatase RsbU/P
MPETWQAVLEMSSPDGSHSLVRLAQSPFLIGRGAETGNHLELPDRRISRQCAAIVWDGNAYTLIDRGHRAGVFVDGERIAGSRSLKSGDLITFGLDNSYQLRFRSSASDASIEGLLTRFGSLAGSRPSPSSGLGRLNLLLEATMLLHSQLPLEAVLGTMLDHAISVTNADRGVLLESDAEGAFRVRLARGRGRVLLPSNTVEPSRTAIRMALQQHAGVITEDLAQADLDLQAAQSIVSQRLRAVVAIPLYATPRADSAEEAARQKDGNCLGIVYLDSLRPAAFSKLDRQILNAIAVESASILDNSRLVARERERQRLEQELSIAREIQQALLPHGLHDFPNLAVSGINFPCLGVGGDYFDVFPVGHDRTAFLIADVSGKGLGAALLTTMLQGALSGMAIGSDPAPVFNHLNRFLCNHAQVGRYATVFFGILNPDGRLEFINAGHPSPLLVRRGQITEPFTEGSFPVGLIPEAEYATACIQLLPNDTLILFSDGVTEAIDRKEEMFGISRLRDVIAPQCDAPLESIQKTVLQSVENFSEGVAQADDITLLLVRYSAASQSAVAA